MGEWVRGRDLSVPVGCRDETDFARVAIPEVGGGGCVVASSPPESACHR